MFEGTEALAALDETLTQKRFTLVRFVRSVDHALNIYPNSLSATP